MRSKRTRAIRRGLRKIAGAAVVAERKKAERVARWLRLAVTVETVAVLVLSSVVLGVL